MKLKIIIAAIIAALAVGGTTTAIIYNNTDEVVFRHSVTGVIEDVFEREEISAVTDVLDGGSVDVELNSVKANDTNVLNGIKLSGKIYFSESALYVENAKLDYAGKCIEANAYVDEEIIYIDENNILGEKYGVDLNDTNFSELFNNSIFYSNSNSKYALDKESSYLISSVLETYDSGEFKGAEKDIEDIAVRYIKECWDIFVENSTFESQSKDVRIGDERKNYRVITVEFDNDNLSDMLNSLITYLDNDDELYEKMELVYEDSDLSKSLNTSFEDFWNELVEELEDIAENLYNYAQKYKIEIVTPKTSSKMLKFTFTANNYKVIEINFGEDGVKKSSAIEISILDELEIIYEVNTTNNDTTIFTLTQKFNGKKYSIFELKLNEKKETYTLKLLPDDTYYKNLTLSGTYSQKGDKTTVTITKFGDLKTDATLIFDTGDKIPKIDKSFTNPLEISEKELDTIIEKLEDELDIIEDEMEEIYDNLESSFVNDDYYDDWY